jgi:hypothetical protein
MSNPEGSLSDPSYNDLIINCDIYDRPLHSPEINVPKLLMGLGLTEADLQALNDLYVPETVSVTSEGQIKTATVEHNYISWSQPEISAWRARRSPREQMNKRLDNRLWNIVAKREATKPVSSDTTAVFSIENGSFRISPGGNTGLSGRSDENVLQFIEGADLTPGFDHTAEYEDRVPVAIRIPGRPVIIQISPPSEAVHFPKEAVLAAVQADGGLEQNTAGSVLADMDIVGDKQNPHAELTVNRPEGPLFRQEQIVRAIIRGLV